MRSILIAAILGMAVTGFTLDDTPANRAAEVERYLKATPPDEMMKDMADNMAVTLPPEMRNTFKDMITKHLDMAAVTKAIRESMAKHFTAAEISALADFYGSEIGKSAMKKLGPYLADIMPVIQAEVMKAQAEAMKSDVEANRQKPDKAK